jgi:TIR domain
MATSDELRPSLGVLDGFGYDVFISYRQQPPDGPWVRRVLLSELRARGLRICVDFECFVLGRPIISEMERAVEQSRYTLAVLTPAYLASNFTTLENVLADHLGLERSERRLLAVMREPCNPRLGLRARLWLDLTDDRTLPDALDRLAAELHRPPGD